MQFSFHFSLFTENFDVWCIYMFGVRIIGWWFAYLIVLYFTVLFWHCMFGGNEWKNIRWFLLVTIVLYHSLIGAPYSITLA